MGVLSGYSPGGPLADLADDGDDVAGHQLRRVDARPRALVGLAAAVDLTGAAPLTVRNDALYGYKWCPKGTISAL